MFSVRRCSDLFHLVLKLLRVRRIDLWGWMALNDSLAIVAKRSLVDDHRLLIVDSW